MDTPPDKSAHTGKEEMNMDTAIIIRVIAGILAVAVLGIIIYRRKKAA